MRTYYIRAIILFISILSVHALGAQTLLRGKINGIENEEPIVRLLRLKDSSVVKTTICDRGGGFEFNGVKNGNYFVSVSHVGYLTAFSSILIVTGSIDRMEVPEIMLVKSSTSLDAVELNAKKPFVQRKIDRVVVNPSAFIGNTNATSLEMLERAPGVTVDLNGNISMKGKPGVVVFIDDKPTYMSSADLSNYLRSLPASAVETFELMTNPPAKYEAAGNAGIINIRLKKTTTKGINGGINVGFGKGRFSRYNNSFNFTYLVNKINLFTNLGWNQNGAYQDLTINRYYFSPNSSFLQNSYIKWRLTGQNARVGMDYYANSKLTLGIVLAGFVNPSRSDVTNNAVILDAQQAIVNRVHALNPLNRKWKNGSINLNGNLKLDKKGQDINANFDHIKYNSSVTQRLINDVYDPTGNPVSSSTLFSNLPTEISITTGSVDYNKPLSQTSKFGAGWKSSFVNTDNTAAFFDVVNNIFTANNTFSNRFTYKENINAGYVNYSKDWKSFSLQAGLRMENTVINGYQFGNPQIKDSAFTRNYTNLFPTFYLLYRADSLQKHQFALSIGRRISRPNYQDMNPFTYPLDRYTYYGGNPFLQPTFSYAAEISFTYKNMITTSFEYSESKNLIQETNEQRNGIFYSRPGNFGKQTIYGFDLNATFKPVKWWMLQLYTEFKNMGYDTRIYNEILKDDRWYWYFGPTNQFTITKNLTGELAGTYQTGMLVGQFLTIPVWQVRAGLSQKLWKGKGSVRLNVSDIFYTNQSGGDIRNITNSKANWLSYLDSRVVSVGFSYRFNKGKSLNARNSGAADAEKGRVKTN